VRPLSTLGATTNRVPNLLAHELRARAVDEGQLLACRSRQLRETINETPPHEPRATIVYGSIVASWVPLVCHPGRRQPIQTVAWSWDRCGDPLAIRHKLQAQCRNEPRPSVVLAPSSKRTIPLFQNEDVLLSGQPSVQAVGR
jgi:hypothetical protein